jgi:hypothetical protein
METFVDVDNAVQLALASIQSSSSKYGEARLAETEAEKPSLSEATKRKLVRVSSALSAEVKASLLKSEEAVRIALQKNRISKQEYERLSRSFADSAQLNAGLSVTAPNAIAYFLGSSARATVYN